MTTLETKYNEIREELQRAYAFIAFIGKWNDYYFDWREATKDVDVNALCIELLYKESLKSNTNEPNNENSEETHLELF